MSGVAIVILVFLYKKNTRIECLGIPLPTWTALEKQFFVMWQAGHDRGDTGLMVATNN